MAGGILSDEGLRKLPQALPVGGSERDVSSSRSSAQLQVLPGFLPTLPASRPWILSLSLSCHLPRTTLGTIARSALRGARLSLDDCLSFSVLRLPLLRGMAGTGNREVPPSQSWLTPKRNRALGAPAAACQTRQPYKKRLVFPHRVSLL